MSSRRPYSGTSRRLVLAFDVGTTFSGISYSILDPKLVPEIKGVMRFPYQDSTAAGDCKVPSIIWYDDEGEVQAIGAGAARDGIEQEALDGRWSKVEWFKLHLRPKTLDTEEMLKFAKKMPDLPACKTVVDVFADYYRFLYQSSKEYIEKQYSTGRLIWESVHSNITFVLSHPNGWEGSQQSQMRRAAILAGLVPDSEEGKSRIQFVTEGEASLHFCLDQGLMTERLKTDSRVLVVDAGGGTIDISSYEKRQDQEGSFSELAVPQCQLRGSIFVTQYARKHLEEYLRNSPFLVDVPEIARCFDKSTKLLFRRKEDPSIIRFGRLRDNDLDHNIRSGSLKLLGETVASFFQSSIDCVTNSIIEHYQTHRIKTVFLVGGFAASDWLFDQVQAAVHRLRIEISRPVSQTNKAVASGAVSFYLDHFVSTRISKHFYGSHAYTRYDANDPEHIARQNKRFVDLDGSECINGAFKAVLPKNTLVDERKEFRRAVCRLKTTKNELKYFTTSLYRYRGTITDPKWTDEDAENYEVMCSIEADTSVASAALAQRRGRHGQIYFKFDYDLVLLFGLTEFKAQIAWQENGVEKRSPARVIYDYE